MSSRPTDLEALDNVAGVLRGCVDDQAKDEAATVECAVAEIRELRRALGQPVPELAGTTALVLYFPDQAAADDFVKLVRAAVPGLKARSLR